MANSITGARTEIRPVAPHLPKVLCEYEYDRHGLLLSTRSVAPEVVDQEYIDQVDSLWKKEVCETHEVGSQVRDPEQVQKRKRAREKKARQRHRKAVPQPAAAPQPAAPQRAAQPSIPAPLAGADAIL